MPTEDDIPVIVAVRGVGDFPDGVSLRMTLADGGDFYFALKRSAVPQFWAAVMDRLAASADGAASSTIMHPIQVRGAGVATSSSGQLGLSIQTVGGWSITLEVNQEVLQGLQEVIAILSNMASPQARPN
jgi:hypothetical protein